MISVASEQKLATVRATASEEEVFYYSHDKSEVTGVLDKWKARAKGKPSEVIDTSGCIVMELNT